MLNGVASDGVLVLAGSLRHDVHTDRILILTTTVIIAVRSARSGIRSTNTFPPLILALEMNVST